MLFRSGEIRNVGKVECLFGLGKEKRGKGEGVLCLMPGGLNQRCCLCQPSDADGGHVYPPQVKGPAAGGAFKGVNNLVGKGHGAKIVGVNNGDDAEVR